MELRIRALDEDEFEAAESNGYVYGTYTRYIDDRLKIIYVFVDLGQEVPYTDKPSDDLNANYRQFNGCTVRAAHTPEQLDARRYLFVMPGVKVVIYC